MEQDVRWLQRLENYSKALARLREAVDIVGNNLDSPNIELLKEGLIQRFEFTHELTWKVMKDYLEYQGYSDVKGSRDAFRKSLSIGIIDNPLWIDSIQTRNITSHTYDEEISNSVINKIISQYFPLMCKLETTMIGLKNEESSLPYLFDLSIFSTLSNQNLIDHISRRGIIIFQR